MLENQAVNAVSNGVTHVRAPAPLADQAILDGLSRALMGDKQDVKKLTATTRVINAFTTIWSRCAAVRRTNHAPGHDAPRHDLKILDELEPQDRLRRVS